MRLLATLSLTANRHANNRKVSNVATMLCNSQAAPYRSFLEIVTQMKHHLVTLSATGGFVTGRLTALNVYDFKCHLDS